jgi:LysR family glycine cleavage system transcriptional activator
MALSGMGVALGQVALAGNDIASGRLIAPFDVRLNMPNPYALVTPRSARRKKRMARVIAALKTFARGHAG